MSIVLNGTELGSQITLDSTNLTEIIFNNVSVWKSRIILKKLPYNLDVNSSVVVLNNEIHILGGNGKDTSHYKWNGVNWVLVSTLPYAFYNGCAVVFNDEIHIMGGSSASRAKKHYKWNGTEWTSVSTLPFYLIEGSAVVKDNEIHIIGSDSSADKKKHYKWNGSRWSYVSTLPYDFSEGSAVVYNNTIHIIGGYNSKKSHYKYSGGSWVSVSTLPYDSYYNHGAVVYDNCIYQTFLQTYFYKWDGTNWTLVNKDTPNTISMGNAVMWNNEYVYLGGYNSNEVSQWDGSSWAAGID